MKILLIGYGKMGKAIEQIALQRGHEILERIDKGKQDLLTIDLIASADVAIEFTSPHSAVHNLKKCMDAKTPVIIGSTGWYAEMKSVENYCQEKNSAMLAASNFSIGVNIFFAVNEYLAKLMNTNLSYDVQLEETHHVHKLDKPSGTAITTAEGIIKNLNRKSKFSLDSHASSEIFIDCKREDEVPGTHTVLYQSEVDSIELKHTAFNRQGFALGAVLAAEFINGKKGVYSMQDLLKI
jgi:4-hydroxy-tetrahydrodipicolinate reductase